MAGPNLEVFKFGMYILFPIGIMYYFGTNLDNKFSVHGFWPSREQSNAVPTEKEDIDDELGRLKAKRLEIRRRRLAAEMGHERLSDELQSIKQARTPSPAELWAAARREG